MRGIQNNRQAPALILLVDDNENGLIARRAVLQEMHHKVVTACNGEEALTLFGQQQFDLVITDHKMPRMTGVDLIQKMRKANPVIPVILLSGLIDTPGLDERTSGADIVISKSASEVSHLMRATSKLLNRRKKPAQKQKREALARAQTAAS
jgi:CheY-like chemotaxis protein